MTLLNRQPISREDIGPLLVQPVESASLAFRTSTTVVTDGFTFRIPVIATDPTVGWFNEGVEIVISDPTLGEVLVTPKKVAGISTVSVELAEDSSPEAAAVVGDGLARDIARKVDAAWYGNVAAPAPAGLGSLVGVQTVVSPFTSLDWAAEAISKAETVGATLDSFVTDPATALTLAKLRTGTGSNTPLLGTDATEAGQRRALGVNIYVSPAVAPGVIWGTDSTKVWTVLREDVDLDVDKSVFWTSHRLGIKAVMRIGFGFAQPNSVVKITAA